MKVTRYSSVMKKEQPFKVWFPGVVLVQEIDDFALFRCKTTIHFPLLYENPTLDTVGKRRSERKRKEVRKQFG